MREAVGQAVKRFAVLALAGALMIPAAAAAQEAEPGGTTFRICVELTIEGGGPFDTPERLLRSIEQGWSKISEVDVTCSGDDGDPVMTMAPPPPDRTALPIGSVRPVRGAPTQRPTDMKPWPGDPSLSWRFLKPAEFECSYSGVSCWGVLVRSSSGCPGALYAALQIMDASGTVIGYTNASAGVLLAGQQAKLIFDTFEDAAKTGRLTELNCY